MKRDIPTKLACLALGAAACLCAQDLTITNVRIIGPNAAVIERGSIVVRDPDGLRALACQCNESVKNHFEEVLRGVYPTEAPSGG